MFSINTKGSYFTLQLAAKHVTDNGRIIYMAPAGRRASAFIDQHKGRLNISYDIYKDKYWMSLNHFKAGPDLYFPLMSLLLTNAIFFPSGDQEGVLIEPWPPYT